MPLVQIRSSQPSHHEIVVRRPRPRPERELCDVECTSDQKALLAPNTVTRETPVKDRSLKTRLKNVRVEGTAEVGEAQFAGKRPGHAVYPHQTATEGAQERRGITECRIAESNDNTAG
jgi:hypothetical protein